MPQQFGAQAALAGSRRSVPSAHMRQLSLPVALAPTASSDPYEHLCRMRILMQRNIHINMIKIKWFSKKKTWLEVIREYMMCL